MVIWIYERRISQPPRRKSWLARRSTLERIFLAMIPLFVLVIIALGIPLTFLTSMSETPHQICSTKECVRAAARLSDKMDTAADPCDDFYKFACGSWMQQTILADDKITWDMLHELDETLTLNLKGVLEETDNEIEAVKKAQIFYQSCMDTAAIEARGISPLKTFIEEMEGGFPLLNPQWNDSGFSLEDDLVAMAKYNNFPLIQFNVQADLQNSSYHCIYYDQPLLGLPGREYYEKGSHVMEIKAYETLAIHVLTGLGAPPGDAASQMKDVLDFEFQIANITVDVTKRLDPNKLYNPTTIKNMSRKYPQFNWLKHASKIMSSAGISVSDEEVIVISSPAYFDLLFPLLSRTSKRTVRNYIMWMKIFPHIKDMYGGLAKYWDHYEKVMTGAQPERRWMKCVNNVLYSLPLAVSRLYVEKQFDTESKSKTLNLITDVLQSFYKALNNNNWMDNETKQKAKLKADAIVSRIGYPDEILNDTYINNLYNQYIFHPGHFLENELEMQRISAITTFNKLRSKVDNKSWMIPPASTNAFYYPARNQIVFASGILQPPLFHSRQPQSLNYGSLGVMVAHELTHGFDSRGGLLNAEGNLLEWWTKTSRENFNNATDCFVKQYGGMVAPESNLSVNGILTLSENIADSGGVNQAYQAYRSYVKQHGEEDVLPGLELYNNNQLFFIAWAQVWCTRLTKEASIFQIYADTHSPGRFRAIGAFQNSREFAEVFNCASGSRMNPVNKCHIW